MNDETEKTIEFALKTLEQVKKYFVEFDGPDITKTAHLMLNIKNAMHKINCLKQLERMRSED